ncbi:MAG: pimeloyl-ACP methyl ester carboxylesterase [Cognaticolwellia sp.]|jgi:pimeloyl-ACP methyl ester carboxylesterase
MFSAMMMGLLGCAPRYTDAAAMDPAELWAPMPIQYTQVQDMRLAYVDSDPTSTKPTLLFVHGLSSYMGFWEYQVPAFTADYRVIAVDLPGYGASDRPDAAYTPPWFAAVLTDFMDGLNLSSVVVVGHSMGGQIALTLALDAPDRVDALVLSAPAGFESFQPGHAAWLKEYWHESRALDTPEENVRTNMTRMVFNHYDPSVERLIEERVRIGRHESFSGTAVAVSRSVAGMVDHPVKDRLTQISVPTLIVFGTADRMIPNPVFTGGRTRSVAEAGQRAIPGSELLMVKGAGHTVHHDAPETFNKALGEFLESL